MGIRVYNTLTRRKEEFEPREPGKVAMYVCGPTVYNHIHIGNARTFLSFDVIRRYLLYRGFDVRFVQNITDVDDKMIAAANEEGIPASRVAERYTAAYLEAMDDLGVMPPSVQPRATETVPQMIEMVERLLETGHAYVVDGDVYFAVRSFAPYGKLSGRDVDDLRSGARVDVDERKRDPLDFALWKSAKPGEPHWPSPWGDGRPGWHLECSVMSEEQLGVPFDIHGGATDLVFPHHENELAQSEAATGRPFVRYWLHGGLLQIDAEKMSKSLGNFMLLKDVLGQYETPVIRLLMLQTHWRSPLEFSVERLDEARTALERIENSVRNLTWTRTATSHGDGAPEGSRSAFREAAEACRRKFETEMDDDFNTAGALGAVFELAKIANAYVAEHQTSLSAADAEVASFAAQEMAELMGVLGVAILPETQAEAEDAYPREVVELARSLAGFSGADAQGALAALLAARAAARTERNWAAADAVRDGLAALGFTVEDTPQGARVSYRSGS